MLALASRTDTHERKESLPGVQVSELGPTAFHPNQAEFRASRVRKVVSCATVPSSHTFESSHPQSTQQKCISGPTERCERCATLGLDYCVYKPTKKRGVGKVLRMGEACGRCRLATPPPTEFE